jgi:hypothetical protein
MVSGLILIGVCNLGKLRTIVSPGGSAVSWLLELDSSPCVSLASTCLGIGMGMAVAPIVLDLAVGTLATVVFYAPTLPSSVLPCSWSLGIESKCCLPIPIDSHQDIAAAEVNPTAHPTPPSSC